MYIEMIVAIISACILVGGVVVVVCWEWDAKGAPCFASSPPAQESMTKRNSAGSHFRVLCNKCEEAATTDGFGNLSSGHIPLLKLSLGSKPLRYCLIHQGSLLDPIPQKPTV